MGMFNKFFRKKNKYLEAQKKSEPVKAKESTETAEDHLRKAYTFWSAKKKLTDAIQECKIAIKINPNLALAHCLLADIYKDLNNLDDAIKSYKDALHIDSNYDLARSNLGMSYHLQGNDEAAIIEWEETLHRGASTIIRMNTEDFIKDARVRMANKRRIENEKKNKVKPNEEPLILAPKPKAKKKAMAMKKAAKAPEKIGDKKAVKKLIEICRDSNVYVRDNAAEALKKVGEPAVEQLIKALKDDSQLVRVNVAWALGRIGDKRAVEPLILALKDNNIRRTTAEALGLIGDDRALEPLSRFKYDSDDLFREITEIAIKKIKANKT